MSCCCKVTLQMFSWWAFTMQFVTAVSANCDCSSKMHLQNNSHLLSRPRGSQITRTQISRTQVSTFKQCYKISFAETNCTSKSWKLSVEYWHTRCWSFFCSLCQFIAIKPEAAEFSPVHELCSINKRLSCLFLIALPVVRLQLQRNELVHQMVVLDLTATGSSAPRFRWWSVEPKEWKTWKGQTAIVPGNLRVQ